MIYKAALLFALVGASLAGRTLKETVNKNVVTVTSTSDDDDDNRIRFQMVRTGSNKLFLRYRAQAGENENDDEDSYFSLRIQDMVEYENTNGQDGYQSDDKLIKTYSFKDEAAFGSFTRQVSEDADAICYSATNGVITVIANMSSEDTDDAKATELKFDLNVVGFPWTDKGDSTVNSELAVIAFVQSAMNIDRTADSDEIDLDDDNRGYLRWTSDCNALNADNDENDDSDCKIVMSRFESSSDSDKEEKGDKVKTITWSFTNIGAKPAALLWDPIMGGQTGAAATAVVSVFALVFAAVATMM